MASRRRRATLWLLRFVFAAGAVLAWDYFAQTETGQHYEFAIYDAMVRMRGPVTPPQDVVVVALDEPTYSALNLPMDRPLPRAYHGKLLKRLAALGAQRVVFDIVFAGRGSSPEGDAELQEGITKVPTVLAVDHGSYISGGETRLEIVKPDAYFSSFATALGLVGMTLDGGVARQFFVPEDPNLREFVSLSEGGAGIDTPAMRGKFELPKERDLVNFYGPARTVKTIPIYQVLEEEVPLPAHFIKNKVVYVGLVMRTGLGSTEKDSFQTPFGDMYGVEIHATQAANMLDQNWIRRPSRQAELGFVGPLIFLCGLLILLLRPQWSALAVLIIAVGWFASSYYAMKMNYFLGGGSAVTALLPLLCLLNTMYWYVRTRKRQVQIEKAFSLYVAPAMVTQLKKNPAMLKLGGEEIVATAMFTDIAGFTTITEQLGAVKVTAMLNAYFTEVSDAVMDEGGTVIKFIGDAVFALWNAPVRQDDHVERAIRAAVRIQETVTAFNQRGEFPPLITRVGLNTGKMVVGNLGSGKRFDFTAIGDSVNLAARVEGVNKYLGSTVLITHDTLENAKLHYNVLKMGAIRVVGKVQPVALYRLFSDPVPDSMRLPWEAALDLFTKREFALATTAFTEITSQIVELKTASELYLEVIELFSANPPKPEWNGEIVLDHK